MTCPGTPIPTSDRHNQVYILAKRLKYFYDIGPAWNVTFFPRAALELSAEFPGFEFVAGYKDEDEPTKMGFPGGMAYPEGVRNLGRLSPEEFARHVKESKALLGIGSPPQSPSPYHALCQGVPFINPVRRRSLPMVMSSHNSILVSPGSRRIDCTDLEVFHRTSGGVITRRWGCYGPCQLEISSTLYRRPTS